MPKKDFAPDRKKSVGIPIDLSATLQDDRKQIETVTFDSTLEAGTHTPQDLGSVMFTIVMGRETLPKH
jgi:hypothetical protein